MSDGEENERQSLLQNDSDNNNKRRMKELRIPQRWITTILCFSGLFNSYSMRVCLSIAITKMVVPLKATIEFAEDTCPRVDEEILNENQIAVHKDLYEWSEYTQGVILSSFYWAYPFSNFLAGELTTKYGGKNILGFGIISSALLTLLTPITIRWGGSTALIYLRLIMGFAEGVTYPAITSLVAQWIPEDERSRAGSIVFSGSPLGTVFGMTLSGIILKYSEAGWTTVFYFFGIVGCLCFILNCIFCFNKPSENPYISHEEANYLKEKLKNTHAELPPTPYKFILSSTPVWGLIILNIGYGYGFLTMISDMPKYMSSVLGFSVENNGYLSSLPYLAFCLVSNVTSLIADSLIMNGRMSVEQVRKIGATVSSMGPAIFLVAACYAGCNRILVVILFTIGMGLMGPCTFSGYSNMIDLSTNYAGAIMGLYNGFGVLIGMFSPLVVGMLTPNQTLSEWRLVFWIVFILFVFSNSTYLVWGSGKSQDWNDPDFLKRNKITTQTDFKDEKKLSENE